MWNGIKWDVLRSSSLTLRPTIPLYKKGKKVIINVVLQIVSLFERKRPRLIKEKVIIKRTYRNFGQFADSVRIND